MPKRAFQLLAVAAATWLVAAVYSLRLNPEVAFFRVGDQQKQAWVRSMRDKHTNIVVIFGGSSCATAIDARRLLEQHGVPAVNAGLGAGMGAKILTRYALELTRPGDTLLAALEPELLTEAIELEPLGVQFAMAAGRPSLLRGDSFVNLPSVLLALRPGGGHVTAMLGKFLGRQPFFRYPRTEWQMDGRHQIDARRPIQDPSLAPIHLSAAGREALALLRNTCRQRGLRVAYVLPWQYCPATLLPTRNRQQLAFLSEVSEFLPVLREPSLGSHTVKEHFADTAVHPIAKAAALRSDELGVSLKAWTLWTSSELNEAQAMP